LIGDCCSLVGELPDSCINLVVPCKLIGAEGQEEDTVRVSKEHILELGSRAYVRYACVKSFLFIFLHVIWTLRKHRGYFLRNNTYVKKFMMHFLLWLRGLKLDSDNWKLWHQLAVIYTMLGRIRGSRLTAFVFIITYYC
jgi:hypothetical protein